MQNLSIALLRNLPGSRRRLVPAAMAVGNLQLRRSARSAAQDADFPRLELVLSRTPQRRPSLRSPPAPG
jgi:hypothetical protein